ncbi:MAG TPA: hypothetical protein VM802_20430 [Chitinophaga sp.]|uniref:hypothetical protein n=1 Tax=Chitinophaga sp. TaxID=1869181 RepID=UPI002C921DB1|nr:hypothetical protein [Chitinophaga sp.]HVI47256.1 hypothetical protein [Chitinophaga sp.]
MSNQTIVLNNPKSQVVPMFKKATKHRQSNLLNTLNGITPYGTAEGFRELCWQQLSNIISSSAADKWSADKRNQFFLFSRFFIDNATAVFAIRDAMTRDRVKDLTPTLVKELDEPLRRLMEFRSVIDVQEAEEVINEYAEILMNDGESVLELSQIEFGASYFKIFFMTLLSLDIEKCIRHARSN